MNRNIAAIDIGSNSLHLIIANQSTNGNLQIIERARKVLRLNDFGTSNVIPENAIKEAIAQLNIFKKLAEKYNAEIKAVATSAVREASNKDEFLNRIFDETKINIEVIDGKKEAELIYLGISKAIKIKDERVLCIDIGGGSTEIIITKKGKIELAESINIGAVRLKKMFFESNATDKENITLCSNYVKKKILDVAGKVKMYKIDLVVGSSGTINTIGVINKTMKNEPVNKNNINGISFTYKDLTVIEEKILSAENINERKKIKGLEEKRADVIPAGVIILKTIFDSLMLKKMTISGFALREGIVLYMITQNKN